MASRILLICSLAPARPLFPGDEPASPAALAGAGHLARDAACLTSPLLRARQTAAALALEARPDPALAEMDYGRWAGREIAQVLSDDPTGFARWRDDPDAAPHGGESFAAVVDRIAGWLRRQAQDGGNLVAVTHPAPIQAALIHVLGAPPQAAASIGVRPLSRMRLSHDGRRWSLLMAP